MNINDKSSISRKIVFYAGILGFLGVIFGAFGAHSLRPGLQERGMVEAWETAVKFHLIHAVALLALAAWAEAGAQAGNRGRRLVGWAAKSWVAGIVLFSGSLYILALGGPHWLGPVTPLGGLALIVGWALVVMAA